MWQPLWTSRRRARTGRLALAGLAAGGLLAAGLVAAGPPAAAATAITLNGGSAGRVFDGIGAISGGGGNSRLLVDYPEPQRSQILDYLFKPGFGAAMSILKVEIGGDTNSTSGAEASHQHTAADLNCNRGYEWWLMEQAKARNPNIKLYGLSWGAPGWIGTGTVFTQNMINYLVGWLNCAKNSHGLTIDYLGGWNEKGRNLTWYQNLNTALDANGFGAVKIVASDDSSGWTVADDGAANSAFRAAVDIYGSHYVCGYRSSQSNCPSTANSVNSGKPLWASENGSDDFNDGAKALARGINRDYIDGKMTAYINWPLIAAITPNIPFPTMGVAISPEPWSGFYAVGKNAWVMAQTSQFAVPGWRYLDSSSGYIDGNRANGSYVTLKAPDNSNYSMVVETVDAAAAQTLNLTVAGGLSTGAVHVWSTNLNSTNPADFLAHTADITPSGGAYSLTVQPGRVYTLTTTTGQGRGTATGPAHGSLALPYRDSYDGYAAGRQPKYLMDQQGAFEVTGCGAGRAGNCVRQMAPRDPVTWDAISDNYALLGDLGWVNYAVSSDVLLEQPGYAEVIGRATWQHSFGPSGLDAYYLRVSDTGAWSIRRNTIDTAVTVLRSGTVTALGTNRWHTVGLSFSGNTITATIDGTAVGSVTDTMWGTGQVGLSTARGETAQFDNLSVTAVSGPPPAGGTVLRGAGSNRCLDVPNQSHTNGVQVEIWDCNGGSNQQFVATSSRQLQVYGNKCLDAQNGSTAAGTPVIISDCTAAASQQWSINADGTVTGVQSTLCLDVTGAGTANGTLVELWTCNGGTNQRWTRT